MKSVFIPLIIVLLVAAGIFFFLHKDKTSSTPVDLVGELRENFHFGGNMLEGPLLFVDDELYRLNFSDDKERENALSLISETRGDSLIVRVQGTLTIEKFRYGDDTEPGVSYESSLNVIQVDSITPVSSE